MLPAYIQIHDRLRDEIDKGEWRIGSRLPSERDLADDFGVSRMTMRQAIGLLVDEGLLERRRGSGTYVVGSQVRETMRVTTSFTEIVKSQGRTPSSRLISYERVHPNEQEVKNLGITAHSYIIRMERVRYADQMPVVFEVAAIPEKFIKNMDKESITSHFFQTLGDNGYQIGKSQQTIYAQLASQQVAEYLEIQQGDAILGLRQMTYFTDGQAFEFVKSQYVADRFEFYLENN
ncbi:GntR family transcriptional regulator [Streptococcus sp. DD12]|uniref:GntR family transcriptional regulator n=1 Tax=Streptococcus sp. DD12 TaxID=1777880 RepID=UPI00079416B7|nr:GntR family transcriptional regulator [Streptococcus sp. DD12]KXT76547.1 Transcriptional regulator in cluster with beta-lactamase, GntR family [Streptococcus sp. DD12]